MEHFIKHFTERFPQFTMLFLALLLKAAPFIVVSAVFFFLFELFVSRRAVARLIGRPGVSGALSAAVAGVFIPAGEWSAVRLARRLRAAGAPMSAVAALMASAPSAGFIVFAATVAAFGGSVRIALIRVAAGVITAFLAGIAVAAMRIPDEKIEADSTPHAEFSERFRRGIEAAAADLTFMLAVLVPVIFIVAAWEPLHLHKFMEGIAGAPAGAAVTALFAFVSSIGSDVDAFAAAGLNEFSKTAVLAFLLLGPVVDLKLLFLRRGIMPAGAAVVFNAVCIVSSLVCAFLFARFL